MRIFMISMVLVLMGCGGPGTGLGGGRAIGPDSCDARSQQRLVGRELTDMAAVSAAAPKVRFIDPGDAVTQDVQPDRLNVQLDENRRVTRVYCG
ncbi:MAG: I78 family peptidase inhibitor [Pseudomonadota bacterium]